MFLKDGKSENVSEGWKIINSFRVMECLPKDRKLYRMMEIILSTHSVLSDYFVLRNSKTFQTHAAMHYLCLFN